ncbi:Uncharacterised protein [Mycobacteroides abscessus subsp. abscessus]|nr:Uncharacterised protein [Mycobacteroides abscessus subsp. abscessus]
MYRDTGNFGRLEFMTCGRNWVQGSTGENHAVTFNHCKLSNFIFQTFT